MWGFTSEGVRAEVKSVSLIERTAEALYLTWSADRSDPAPYDSLTEKKRQGWERLALTALTIAYREPVQVHVHHVP